LTWSAAHALRAAIALHVEHYRFMSLHVTSSVSDEV